MKWWPCRSALLRWPSDWPREPHWNDAVRPGGQQCRPQWPERGPRTQARIWATWAAFGVGVGNGAKVFGIERAHRGLTTTELQSVPLAVSGWYTARSRGLLDGEDEASGVLTSHREQTRAFQPGPTTSRFSQAGGRARYLWIPAVAPPRVPWQRQRGAGWLLCFS